MEESKDMGEAAHKDRLGGVACAAFEFDCSSNLDRSFGHARLLRKVFSLASDWIALFSSASAPSSSRILSFDL